MAARYGDVAAWAREAGYDGIQLGSANAKLLDQFLSPFYNRRTDEFGGLARARGACILRLIREAIAERAGADFPALVKVPAETGAAGSRRTSPPTRRCAARTLVEEWGFDAVTPVEVSVFPDTTLSRGGVPDSFWTNPAMSARLREGRAVAGAPPGDQGRRVVGGQRARSRRCGTGRFPRGEAARRRSRCSRSAGSAPAPRRAEILDAGEADLVGIGRPFYAEPDLAARILGGDAGTRRCRNSNRCVPAQMLGMKGVCYNPEVTRG